MADAASPRSLATALIENGFVHIPEDAPWLAEYLHEMTVFQ
jgi:phage terminase large subunit-like protein